MERNVIISIVVVVVVIAALLGINFFYKDFCDGFGEDKAICESAVEKALAAHPGKVSSVEKKELPLAPNLATADKTTSTTWLVSIKTEENKIEVSVDEEGKTKLTKAFVK